MRNIADEEIDEAERNLIKLHQAVENAAAQEVLLSFPIDIQKGTLREVADYLNDPDPRGNEIKAWDQLLKGNYYGYCIYVHETIEINAIKELVKDPKNSKYCELNLYEANRVPDIRKKAHGDGCFAQYKLLQDYMRIRFGRKEQRLTQLTFCDSWDMVTFDRKSAEKLSSYLKNHQNKWYHEYGEKYPWEYDYRLRELFGRLREENGD